MASTLTLVGTLWVRIRGGGRNGIQRLFWILVSSLSTRIELYSVPVKHWIPLHPTLANYKAVFSSGPQYRAGGSPPSATLLLSGVRNSLITSVGAALVMTVLSTLAAYAFARLR